MMRLEQVEEEHRQMVKPSGTLSTPPGCARASELRAWLATFRAAGTADQAMRALPLSDGG